MDKIIIKDLEEIEKITKQLAQLQHKVKTLSLYDSKIIGDILANLMSEFEKIEYHCVKDTDLLGTTIYSVEPKVRTKFHPTYKLKSVNNMNGYYNYPQETNLTLLEPSNFINKNLQNNIKNTYIRYFINFLYNKRVNNSLEQISILELKTILEEFLQNTKDIQEQRKLEIEKLIIEIKQQEARYYFEKSCLIDRKLIYNALIYIVNKCEDNMHATQEYKEEWSRTGQWSELYGYHNLIIQTKNDKVCFKTLVDQNGCYPDEEYCGVYVNLYQKGNINFFELKKALASIIKESEIIKQFIDTIETYFNENINITSNEIENILITISNEKKKKRVLTPNK